jgi:hypothetical protein
MNLDSFPQVSYHCFSLSLSSLSSPIRSCLRPPSEWTPTPLKVFVTLVLRTVPILYIAWTWFRYLSPAIFRGHLSLLSPRVPSDRLARGFIAFTCLCSIPVLSFSWRFKRREIPHINFNAPSEAISTCRFEYLHRDPTSRRRRRRGKSEI